MQVGNSNNINNHVTECDTHIGTIPTSSRSAVLHCDPPRQARFVSIVNSRNPQGYYYFAICEAVVIGYKAIGWCSFLKIKHSSFYIIVYACENE